MTAYQRHRQLIKRFASGERISLNELIQTRAAAERIGRKAVQKEGAK